MILSMTIIIKITMNITCKKGHKHLWVDPLSVTKTKIKKTINEKTDLSVYPNTKYKNQNKIIRG
jgi:hypothetical protein